MFSMARLCSSLLIWSLRSRGPTSYTTCTLTTSPLEPLKCIVVVVPTLPHLAVLPPPALLLSLLLRPELPHVLLHDGGLEALGGRLQPLLPLLPVILQPVALWTQTMRDNTSCIALWATGGDI